jgi:hypothetical protein
MPIQEFGHSNAATITLGGDDDVQPVMAFCSPSPVQNTKLSSNHTPTSGVTCGRPSPRTVVSHYNSAPANDFLTVSPSRLPFIVIPV